MTTKTRTDNRTQASWIICPECEGQGHLGCACNTLGVIPKIVECDCRK